MLSWQQKGTFLKAFFFPCGFFSQLPAPQTSAGVRESSWNLLFLQMIHTRDSVATSRLPNLLQIQEPEHNTSLSLFSLCMTMGRMEEIHLDFLIKSSKSPGILKCVEKFFLHRTVQSITVHNSSQSCQCLCFKDGQTFPDIVQHAFFLKQARNFGHKMSVWNFSWVWFPPFQKGRRKKRWMNLTAESVLLWGKNCLCLNYSLFLNLGSPNESSWSLKNGSLYCSSEAVTKN